MKKFGLIGKNISNSKSPFIHNNIYEKYDLKAHYQLYENLDLSNINKLKKLDGFNVTIPYKKDFMVLLDETKGMCTKIGSVNTVKIKDDKLIGYNTDYIGFKKALRETELTYNNVLIFGNGGLGIAVKFYFEKYNVPYTIAEINGDEGTIHTDEALKRLNEFDLIVNCSPERLPIEQNDRFLDCRTVTYFGEQFLIYQAQAAFWIWFDLYEFESTKAFEIFQDLVGNGTSFDRLTHTLSVMKKAKEINVEQELNLDVESIEIATVLHDFAKEEQNSELYPDLPKSVVHGFVSRDIAASNYNIDDQHILNAIAYHTTGRPNMSVLEELVCVSDFVEDFRTIPICVKARKVTAKNYKSGLAMKFEYNCNEHPNTITQNEVDVLELYKEYL